MKVVFVYPSSITIHNANKTRVLFYPIVKFSEKYVHMLAFFGKGRRNRIKKRLC
jgi:hypothetical protein